MIKNKKDLKTFLKYEKENYKRIPKLWPILSFLGVSEKSIIWNFQRRLRKWEYHLNQHNRIRTQINKFLCLRIENKYGLHIQPNCFDKGLKIMHLGSILVNSNAVIGENCVLHINTSIVATGGSSDSPKLGNNVMIGVGATLIGNIEIGNNVVIGAGSIVVKSFMENHITIAGVPAKIVSHNAIL